MRVLVGRHSLGCVVTTDPQEGVSKACTACQCCCTAARVIFVRPRHPAALHIAVMLLPLLLLLLLLLGGIVLTACWTGQ